MNDIFFVSAATTKTATTTSASYAIPGNVTSGRAVARIVRQASGNRVWIKFASSGTPVAASSDSTELLPGVVETFLVPGSGSFAIITDTGTVDVNVSIGQGS